MLYADGKLGPVNLNFDFVYDNGWVKKEIAGAKVNYDGWASRLKVDYPWEAFNFGFVAAYGSGADSNKTSTTGLPGAAVANPGAAPATELTRLDPMLFRSDQKPGPSTKAKCLPPLTSTVDLPA